MVDPLDIVIAALLKAGSTEVVKRGLDSLSDQFKHAFARKDAVEIKKVAEDEGVASNLADIARVSLETSVLIPVSAPVAQPEQRVASFEQMLRLGFKVSEENKTDIVVPGSFIDENHISIFSTSGYVPKIIRPDSVNLLIDDFSRATEGFYAIIPTGNDSPSLINDYKNRFIEWRDDSPNYFKIDRWLGEYAFTYRVVKISAGSVFVQYSAAFQKHGLPTDGKLKITNYATNYAKGIQSMLAYMRDYPGLTVLSSEEILTLTTLMEQIRSFGIGHK